jgi:hypothetical protein
MWQRIQTVFLAIAILCLVAAVFLPIWVYEDAAGKRHDLYALHYSVTENGEKTSNYFPYAITAMLLIAAATVAFIEIGKFKDRVLQIKLGALNSVFLAGALGAGVYFASTMVKTFQGGQYGLGLWLPGIAVICNWLAMRFIRRDEKLVRDSNRLR